MLRVAASAMVVAAVGRAARAIEPPSSPPAAAIQIATLLPTRAPAFARASAALMAGIDAARKGVGLPTELLQFEVAADAASTLDGMRRANEAAVQVVIGPLTRSAVQVLATSGPILVPVVALSALDGAAPNNLYPLGLSLDADARQIARVALTEAQNEAPGQTPVAAVIASAPALFRRAAQAFADEFRAGGGEIALSVDWLAGREAVVGKAVTQTRATSVFLALDRAGAVAQRPFCGRLAAFATAQIDDGRDAAGQQDLDGVRFIEVPWRVQPDAAALAPFARPATPLGAPELDRLYALGIDALRVAVEIARGHSGFALDGATGLITVSGNRVERRGAIAVLRDGVVALDAPA